MDVDAQTDCRQLHDRCPAFCELKWRRLALAPLWLQHYVLAVATDAWLEQFPGPGATSLRGRHPLAAEC